MTEPAIKWETRRAKPLSEVTAADIPRGLSAEDVAIDGPERGRRTNAEKHHAVMKLLRDPKWSRWSDGQIARSCAVSQPFVSSLRRRLKVDLSGGQRRYRQGGIVREMDVRGIGKIKGDRVRLYKYNVKVEVISKRPFGRDDLKAALIGAVAGAGRVASAEVESWGDWFLLASEWNRLKEGNS